MKNYVILTQSMTTVICIVSTINFCLYVKLMVGRYVKMTDLLFIKYKHVMLIFIFKNFDKS